MKLYRYLLASFKPKLTQNWEKRHALLNDVTVTFSERKAEDKSSDLRLVTASAGLTELPKLDTQNGLMIPDADRVKCEQAAELLINIVSVLEASSRSLLSPMECVALGAESQSERDFLNSSQGIRSKRKGDSGVSWNIEWTEEIAKALSDRMDGVMLLSEALSAGAESGTYRDLVRFLELAFGVPFYGSKMSKKLCQFLEQVGYGYTRQEIDEWLSLRHPVTHADGQKSNWLALTSDVRHVIMRMQQACVDVLFNKEQWHNSSKTRRSVWRPDAMTMSVNGSPVIRQGAKVGILFRSYDEFGIFPRNINVSMDHSKDELYSKYFPDEPPSQLKSPHPSTSSG